MVYQPGVRASSRAVGPVKEDEVRSRTVAVVATFRASPPTSRPPATVVITKPTPSHRTPHYAMACERKGGHSARCARAGKHV
jgi:hypothetical protein